MCFIAADVAIWNILTHVLTHTFQQSTSSKLRFLT